MDSNQYNDDIALSRRRLSRRQVLRIGLTLAAVPLAAACGQQQQPAQPAKPADTKPAAEVKGVDPAKPAPAATSAPAAAGARGSGGTVRILM